jgi:phosphoglucan,water dikinase
VGRAVSEVWASLYTPGAVVNRLAAGVPQTEARMAIFIQEMAPSDVSFVLRTAGGGGGGGGRGNAPSATLEAEVAVGLGETSAAAASERGSPWRLQVDQTSGQVRTTEFASLGKVRMFHAHSAHLGVGLDTTFYSRWHSSRYFAVKPHIQMMTASLSHVTNLTPGSACNPT